MASEADSQAALVEAIRQRIWNSEVALEAIPGTMKSMILWEEQKLLHWLTRSYYSGSGLIGDLGCFVGSSSLSLATGLAAREDGLAPGGQVHAYDMFITPKDPYTLERLPAGYQPGDSFRDHYDDNIASLRDWITVHDGDLRADPWTLGPIEILFVDICKCWTTNRMVLESFFPHLIPGRSIVIHQDFVHVWTPWIPVTMAALSDYFEVLCEEASSRVYRCVKAVPPELAGRDFRTTLSLEEKCGLLRETIDASGPHTAAILRGALAMQVFMEGDEGDARALLAEGAVAARDDAVAREVFGHLEGTFDFWKTGSAYEAEMEGKFS